MFEPRKNKRKSKANEVKGAMLGTLCLKYPAWLGIGELIEAAQEDLKRPVAGHHATRALRELRSGGQIETEIFTTEGVMVSFEDRPADGGFSYKNRVTEDGQRQREFDVAETLGRLSTPSGTFHPDSNIPGVLS